MKGEPILCVFPCISARAYLFNHRQQRNDQSAAISTPQFVDLVSSGGCATGVDRERERVHGKERGRGRGKGDWSEGIDRAHSSPFLLAVPAEAPSSTQSGKWHWLCAFYNVYSSFTAHKTL